MYDAMKLVINSISNRKRGNWNIALQSNGFLITNDQTQIPVRWDSIIKITAYKLDRLTTDLICFRVETEDGEVLVVTEEENGFYELEQALSLNLDGFVANWRSQVVQPAFRISDTVIYSRTVRT